MRTLLCCLLWLTLVPPAYSQDQQPPPAVDPEKLRLTVELETGGHTAPVARLLFTPDGKQLVSVGQDMTIRYWDVEAGELKKTLRPPFTADATTAKAQAVAVSPDGNLLAMRAPGSGGRKVTFFNLTAGRVERILEVKELKDHYISSLDFSPDGKRLALGCWERMVTIDALSGKVLHYVATGAGVFNSVAFSPDGKRVAGGWGGNGYLVDLAVKGKFAAQFKVAGDYPFMGWAPDGSAMWVGTDQGIQLLDPRTGKLLKTYRVGPTSFLKPLPDGQGWLTAGVIPKKGGRVSLFDPKTGKEQFYSLKTGYPHPHTVALSPDGKWLASAGGSNNAIYLWKRDAPKAAEHFLQGKGGPILSAAWSPDGSTIAFNRLARGDAKTYFEQRPLTEPAMAFDLRQLVRPETPPDLKQFKRAILNQAGSALRVQFKPAVVRGGKSVEMKTWGYLGHSGTFLKDGRVVVAALTHLLVMDPKTGAVRRAMGRHLDEIRDMAPSPDGKYLLTASRDQRLQIYRVDVPGKERLIATLFVSGQEWILWTPEGYYAATPGGEKMMGWTAYHGPDQLKTFYPAERFRKQLYRPDVLKLLLEKGTFKEALEVANAALAKQGQKVAEGPAEVDNLLPPTVSLAVVDQKQLPRLKLKATAVASAKDQPVVALRLLMDGRPLPDGSGVLDLGAGKARAEVEWEVTLPQGKHHFVVLARSPDASDKSETVAVTYLTAEQKPALHVLAVGIDAYEDKELQLQFAVKDARAIADAFRKTAKSDLYRSVDCVTLPDGQARREAILKELAALRQRVKQNDLVVVFFAGHGVKEKDQFYLLTVEARADNLARTALSGDQLRKELAEFRCQVLLLLDACHSAGFGKGKRLQKLGLRPATDDAARSLTDDEVGVAVLCAAMGHEKAEERSGNGLFTRALVEALQGAKGVPRNRRNHLVYVHHLFAYVFEEVSHHSDDRQHPFLSLPWIVESFPVTRLP